MTTLAEHGQLTSQSAPTIAPTEPAATPRNPLREMLHDEIAAAQAYAVAADACGVAGSCGIECRGIFRQFQEEHDLAADVLRQMGQASGDAADDRAGSLGAWAGAVRCARQSIAISSLLGSDNGAGLLLCLRDAEVGMLERYIERQRTLSPDVAAFVKDELLAAMRRHIRALGHLLGEDSVGA